MPRAVPTPTQGVYGRCAPGEMLALLGPSGSGKYTFLDMLSGRKSLGIMTGRTTLNGKAVSGTGMRRLASYVVQVRQARTQSGPGLVRAGGSGLEGVGESSMDKGRRQGSLSGSGEG